MQELKAALQGKKTYVVAIFSLVALWINFFLGEPAVEGAVSPDTLQETITLTIPLVLAMTFRASMGTTKIP